jgi:O-antigen ligase
MNITPLHAKAITFLFALLMMALVRWPDLFVCFYFLCRPLIEPFQYKQFRLIGDIPLSAVLPLVLIVYAFFLTLFAKQRTFFPKNFVFLYVMLFFFTFSAFFSSNYFATISWFLKFLTGMMMFILVYNNVKNEHDFMFFIKSLVYCSLIPMAFGYYQYVTGTGHAWAGEYYKGSRIDSFLGHYNSYSEFLCLIICAALIWLSKETRKGRRILVVLALCSLVASLVLSLSRGSWISLAFGLCVASLRFHRQINMKLVLIGFTLVALVFTPVIVKRFEELSVKTEWGSKNTLAGRAQHWREIFDLVMERPLLGYGAGTAQDVMNARLKNSLAPHNDYLLLWFECGFFSMMTYLLFLSANAVYFLTRRNTLVMVNYALVTACFYFMLLSFFQNIIQNVVVFPMFLGLLGAGLKLNILAESSSFKDGRPSVVSHASVLN